MTVEEHLDRTEAKLQRLAKVGAKTMDLLGLTMEGERRLETRGERVGEYQLRTEENRLRMEEGQRRLRETLHEIGERLNALRTAVEQLTRRKE
jgi:hypothetical protein